MAKSITPNIHEVTHYMNQVIDFEESSLKNQFTVRSGVDRKLDLRKYTQQTQNGNDFNKSNYNRKFHQCEKPTPKYPRFW